MEEGPYVLRYDPPGGVKVGRTILSTSLNPFLPEHGFFVDGRRPFKMELHPLLAKAREVYLITYAPHAEDADSGTLGIRRNHPETFPEMEMRFCFREAVEFGAQPCDSLQDRLEAVRWAGTADLDEPYELERQHVTKWIEQQQAKHGGDEWVTWDSDSDLDKDTGGTPIPSCINELLNPAWYKTIPQAARGIVSVLEEYDRRIRDLAKLLRQELT